MADRNLKVALVPLDIVFGNPQANIKALEERLATIDSDTDLVVVPEMFSTGYTTERDTLRGMAEEPDGPALTAVRELSGHYGFAIAGAYLARENNSDKKGDRVVNRGFFVTPTGETYFYDKHHLFRAGGEHELIERGTEQSPVIEFRSWRIKMAVCYDIRFPVWNRNRNLEYDLLIVPANWAHAREYAWRHMLIARAIENQIYVAGCNREGEDAYGVYERGDSFIFNHWGKEIGERREDGTVVGLLEADRLTKDRKRFSPWKDADDFTLNAED